MIHLYDTLTREKRLFVPQNEKRITMYVCGPTVYGRAHIGNARPAVVFDTLARLIRHQFGPDSLTYARNVTDVDDKIIAAAEAEGVEPVVITDRYERIYLDDMGALGVQPPDIAPHATQNIPAMIGMIERLIERGFAYAADGHVLFHVPSNPDYGELSRRDREAMLAGARVEVAPYKRDPSDFVLWKPSLPDVVGWDSPWGRGRPGWHIECSAMIEAHLGETIDIHGGGLDLIFPHHENEIAQSRCAHGGIPLARYWVHNGFVDMGSEKMSKSLGNIVTVGELLEQGDRGEVLRLALLSAHYRQPLSWTEGLVAQSKTILDRWYRGLERFALDYDQAEYEPHVSVVSALADDLNTPAAISALGAGLKSISVDRGQVFSIDRETGSWFAAARLLGLFNMTPEEWFKGPRIEAAVGTAAGVGSARAIGEALTSEVRVSDKYEVTVTNERIDALIEKRSAAKSRRDFAEADRIRDELKAEGIQLLDRADGTTDWERV